MLGLLCGLATAAWAQGPEGSGSVDLSGTYTTPYSPYSFGTPYSGDGLRVDWGLPLSAGLGLRGDVSWLNQGSTYTGADYFPAPPTYSSWAYARYNNSFSSNDCVADLLLDLYVGGLRGKPFIPGQGANPDGWLRRLSVTVGLHFEDYNYSSALSVGDPIDQTYAYNTGLAVYGGFTGLTLPLAHWLSLGGRLGGTAAYQTVGPPGGGYTENQGQIHEIVDLFAHVYVNLVRGAGADTARPFVPHYGRLGQMMLGLDVERMGGDAPMNSGTDSGRLSLGAPLTASLALGLDFTLTNRVVDGAQYTDYTQYPAQATLHLAWAFGNPAGRVAE
jgi:hypothetical protein